MLKAPQENGDRWRMCDYAEISMNENAFEIEAGGVLKQQDITTEHHSNCMQQTTSEKEEGMDESDRVEGGRVQSTVSVRKHFIG